MIKIFYPSQQLNQWISYRIQAVSDLLVVIFVLIFISHVNWASYDSTIT